MANIGILDLFGRQSVLKDKKGDRDRGVGEDVVILSDRDPELSDVSEQGSVAERGWLLPGPCCFREQSEKCSVVATITIRVSELLQRFFKLVLNRKPRVGIEIGILKYESQ